MFDQLEELASYLCAQFLPESIQGKLICTEMNQSHISSFIIIQIWHDKDFLQYPQVFMPSMCTPLELVDIEHQGLSLISPVVMHCE